MGGETDVKDLKFTVPATTTATVAASDGLQDLTAAIEYKVASTTECASVQGSSTFESELCKEMKTVAKVPSGTVCAVATSCEQKKKRRLESERRLSTADTTS